MTQPSSAPPPGEPTLCDADMRVLDFLAEHGFDASKVNLLPEADRPRALALVRQMQVLDQYPADAADDSLVDATLARIDRWEAANEASRRLDRHGIASFRLSDFVSIAALILVGVGVMLPIAARVREQSLTTVCGNNMRALQAGLGAYARNNDGLLPAVASIASFGSLFDRSPAAPPSIAAPDERMRGPALPTADGRIRIQTQVFNPRPGIVIRLHRPVGDWSGANHSAHLALLVAQDYCNVHALRCPACAVGAPCFAYRVPSRGERFVLETPSRSVVVADANPMIDMLRSGRVPDSRAMSSRNHGGSGQNMLFSDGSIDWRTSPILTNSPASFMDNIWLPRDPEGRERMDLKAWPSHPADNFVAQ